MHPKYLRGFYKYLLCSKKNSGELLWSAHTVLHTNCLPLWHRCNNQQNLFLPWWRTCADAQDGVTHICELRVGCWKQGGWATHDARRVGVGNPCTAQAPVTELTTRHKALLRRKIHQAMNRRGWERRVRSESWRPRHVSSALFSRVFKDSVLLCSFVCMCVTIYLTWNLPF